MLVFALLWTSQLQEPEHPQKTKKQKIIFPSRCKNVHFWHWWKKGLFLSTTIKNGFLCIILSVFFRNLYSTLLCRANVVAFSISCMCVEVFTSPLEVCARMCVPSTFLSFALLASQQVDPAFSAFVNQPDIFICCNPAWCSMRTSLIEVFNYTAGWLIYLCQISQKEIGCVGENIQYSRTFLVCSSGPRASVDDLRSCNRLHRA